MSRAELSINLQIEPMSNTGLADFNGQHIHFVGIGGIGMSGIASILLRQGYAISGSDIKESPITKKLSALGAHIFIGHDALNINGADTLVYSSAIKADNPELLAAKSKGVLAIRRAEALAKLMNNKTCIAISGAHGKTTTTALVSHLLLQAGLFPTVAIGGILRNLDDNAHLGKSKYFVAEADESDGTFLYYRPDYSIVTNIDREHLDYYKSWDNIVSAYAKFISNTKGAGCLFCCGDDPAIRQITKGYKKRITYFGLSEDNDFYPKDIILHDFSSSFDCFCREKFMGRIILPLAGRHNIQNSLSVIALGCELGIDFKKIAGILSSFKGTERRFQLKLDVKGIKIIDDYGHHPSEIKATLLAAKNVSHKRLMVLFQPHRYSRTKFLLDDFAGSFTLADYLILTDIYGACESPIAGISSEVLCDRIKQLTSRQALYLNKEKILEHVIQNLRPGDLILTLGAGDIGRISDELVERLKA